MVRNNCLVCLNYSDKKFMFKFFLENIKVKFRKILIYKIGVKLFGYFEKLIFNYFLIGNIVFFEFYYFEWVNDVDVNWMLIRKELDELFKYWDDLLNF